MFQTFRFAMAWVHTWFGLVLGFVLMAAFFFGTLAVFDREIDRWAVPATRVAAGPMPSFDRVLRPVLERMQPEPEDVAALPGAAGGAVPARFDVVSYWDIRRTRDPITYLYAGYEVPGAKSPDERVYATRMLVAASGELLDKEPAFIGTGFFYPLHFNLTLEWAELGAWIIGLAAFVMLAALVSGVVMHRRIFREFFTFRPRKAVLRSTLDLHNLTGVVALPFHFFFALTGLLIFAGIYFPVAETQLHPLHELHERHEEGEASAVPHRRAGVPAPLAPVDPMVAQAQQYWAARGLSDQVEALILVHVGDANGRVIVSNAVEDRVVPAAGSSLRFRASTGELLHESPGLSAAGQVIEYLAGLHLMHFRHWLLRWLYVAGGLLGCVCIATGFIFFVEKRKAQHMKSGSPGCRIVDALAVCAVPGMVIAAVAMLAANRLLPDDLPDRNHLQRWTFWAAWVLSFIHAALRSAPVARALVNPAWREQCGALVLLALAAVALNWATTGDHLVRTIVTATYWPVAGVDLSLIATALLAALAARRLARRA